MDLDGNHKMDWFFNEYVYGTQLPTYSVDATFAPGPDGDFVMNLKVTESGVDEHFRMLVPVYIELGDGNMVLLGRARMVGNNTIQETVPLKGVKVRPKRALVNFYADVLASPN